MEKMIKLLDLITEKIVLDIKPGDVILGGRFKNKKIVVKSIGKDEHGMPTINGRKVVNFRIAPKKEIKERIDFHDTATQIVKKAGLKSKVVFAKRKVLHFKIQKGWSTRFVLLFCFKRNAC